MGRPFELLETGKIFCGCGNENTLLVRLMGEERK